jgi:SAM-dependent methyltransferase
MTRQQAIDRAFDAVVDRVYDGYREAAEYKARRDRILFYAALVDRLFTDHQDKHVLDLGGGLSPFAPLLAALGYRVTMIDDFGGGGGIDPKRRDEDLAVVTNFRTRANVHVVEQDFLSGGLPVADASVDVVTSFHSIEHWHSSPIALFGEIRRVCRADSYVIIGCPNSVNLRKRLWVLGGRTNHGSLHEWYYDGQPFRGHVREPTLAELEQLLRWNEFETDAVYGRNFIGAYSHSLPASLRFAWLPMLRVVEPLLRARPTLCSDIHVVAKRRHP